MVISVIFSAAVSPICQLQLYLTVSPPTLEIVTCLKSWSSSWCQSDWCFHDGGNYNHDPLQRQPVRVNPPVIPEGISCLNPYPTLFLITEVTVKCIIQIMYITETCNWWTNSYLKGLLRHLHQGWSRRTAMTELQWVAWGHKHPSCRTQPVA